MKIDRKVCFVILVAFLLASCSPAASIESAKIPDYPVFEGGSDLLAYAAQKTSKDQYEVFVYHFDHKESVQLTKNGFADISPTWSADGQKILYASNVIGIYQIFSMNADGSGQLQVIHSKTDDTQPAWQPGPFPDNKISYQNKGRGDFDIYIYDLVNKTNQAITPTDSQETQAAWSPDGQMIAFVSNKDGDFDIYVMDADGQNIKRLTVNEFYDSSPAWSPDGKKIAFISKRSPDQHFQLYVINADGSQETQITKSDFTISSPVWSPDGKTIAFISESSQGSLILAIDLESRKIYQVASGYYDYAGLSWFGENTSMPTK
jgi:Tol biopolymer transport system component